MKFPRPTRLFGTFLPVCCAWQRLPLCVTRVVGEVVADFAGEEKKCESAKNGSRGPRSCCGSERAGHLPLYFPEARLIALVEGPLFDALGAKESGVQQQLEMLTRGRLAHP